MDALKKWFGLGILAKALDVITTIYLVYRDGPDVESHPLTAGMISTYGLVPGLALNCAIVWLLLWALYRYERKRLLIVSTALMVLVVLTNAATIIL